MANEENLTPVKPGQVLNPKGRGKGVKNRATIFKKYLELKAKKVNFPNLPEDLPDDMTIEEAMHFAQLDRAVSGDLAAFKEIQDTVHGKIKETAQVNHSFRAMGTVKIGGAPDPSNPGVAAAPTILTFDVGQDIKDTDADDDEEDDFDEDDD